MDRKRYPACWDAVARFIKTLNNWECACCGRPCRRPGETDAQLRRRIKKLSKKSAFNWAETLDDKPSGKPKLGRFTLTVAHLDHDPPNIHPDNLRPWCSVCHCLYDLTPMAMARKIKLKLEHEATEIVLTLCPETQRVNAKAPRLTLLYYCNLGALFVGFRPLFVRTLVQ